MTAKRPWYKRYPSDFIAGTAGMPLGLRGTYSLVLDMIYDHGAPIDDKAADIARVIGCDHHTWTVHRAKLIKAGKLTVKNGKISNPRADRELVETGKIPIPDEPHETGTSRTAQRKKARPINSSADSGKIPESNVSRTKPRKPNGHADLPQSTYARARDLDTRYQIQTPLAPFGKGGEKTGRTRHGRKKQSRRDDIIEAIEERRAEREGRGRREGGGGDSQ